MRIINFTQTARNANIEQVLDHFGISATAHLGGGAEAQVYALATNKVLRINRAGAAAGDIDERVSLLARMGRSTHFETPIVRDHGQFRGFYYTVEDRLPGVPMHIALAQASAGQRANLVLDYLETATRLGGLFSGTTIYGELARHAPIQDHNFKAFLQERAAASLGVCGVKTDITTIIDDIASPDHPSLVHLDYCPSNVLCEGEKISAVLDFGGTTIAGCASFNPVVATAFMNPMITPSARPDDHTQALEWLHAARPISASRAITKWLAAYWSFCGENEDLALYRWCRTTLDTV